MFVVVTFLIAAGVYLPLFATDLGWNDITLPLGLPDVRILSPAIATLLIRLYDDGVDGVRRVLGGLTVQRFGRVWQGVTLALPVAFAAVLAVGVLVLAQDFSPEPIRIVAETGVAFVALILVTIILSAGEEVGWRGHLLPLLQARLNALNASFVIAVI